MENLPTHLESDYQQLIRNIGQSLQTGRIRAYQAATQISVQTRWEIGRHIVEFVQTLSVQLSWSHYCKILVIEDELERSFYYQQAIIEK